MFSSWFPEQFPIRDPVLIFAIVLILFLASPLVMNRFRLPGMIGLLLAGAILGPHALGILARDSSFVLLGSVGLIYIMFTAALEVELSAFRKYGIQGVVFGLLSFSIPMSLGMVMSRFVLGFEWPAAVLLASMFASHTLLAFPIVSRLGLSANQAVTTTLGGSMITDTGALLVLAVVAGMAAGEVNEAFWWRLGVSMVIFVSGIMLGLPRLGRWFFRRFAEDGPGEFVFVLTSVFLCAALSRAAGLEPILGAFLAGLALNRLIPHNSTLMNRLVFTGQAIFIPFFLLSVGMILDAKVLFGGFRTWVVAIGMTITVIGTKWLAAQSARILLRYRREEGQVMFGLSVVQAAGTLAAVMVGHRVGLFDDTVVNGTIIMILVTCVLGPSVVSRAAPLLAKALESEAPEPTAVKGILIPLSSSEQAEPAVELALLLRGKEKTTPIFPAFIAGEAEDPARAMADGEKILAKATSFASATESVVQPVKRMDDQPGRALVRARKELGARQVIVPWDAMPSQSGGTIGRIIDPLAADPGADLFLCRLPHPLGTCTRIVSAVPAGSAASEAFAAAARIITRLSKALGAPVLLLAQESEKAPVESAFRAAGDLRPELAFYASARMWMPLLEERMLGSDLLLVLELRSEDAAPEFRSYGQRLVAKYAKNDVIVLYPASAEVPNVVSQPALPLEQPLQPAATYEVSSSS